MALHKGRLALHKRTFGTTGGTFGATERTFGATDGMFGAMERTFGATEKTFGATGGRLALRKRTFGATGRTFGATEKDVWRYGKRFWCHNTYSSRNDIQPFKPKPRCLPRDGANVNPTISRIGKLIPKEWLAPALANISQKSG